MNNDVMLFLQEFVQRLKTKSPKFFQVLAAVSGVFVLITGLPDLLQTLNIHLPDLWNERVTQAVAWASRGILLISLLTTQSKAVAVDSKTGGLLKATNTDALPYTAKKEEKAAAKQESLPTVEESAVG